MQSELSIWDWHLSHPWKYLVFCLLISAVLRAVASMFRAAAMTRGDIRPSKSEQLPSFGLAFGQCFWGLGKDKTHADLWTNFIVGFAEIAAYPVLLKTGNISIVGGWLALRTALGWSGWRTTRTSYNRFLIISLAELAIAYFWLSHYVELGGNLPVAASAAPSKWWPPPPLWDIYWPTIGVGALAAYIAVRTLAATKKTADAARLNAQAAINSDRPWLVVGPFLDDKNRDLFHFGCRNQGERWPRSYRLRPRCASLIFPTTFPYRRLILRPSPCRTLGSSYTRTVFQLEKESTRNRFCFRIPKRGLWSIVERSFSFFTGGWFTGICSTRIRPRKANTRLDGASFTGPAQRVHSITRLFPVKPEHSLEPGPKNITGIPNERDNLAGGTPVRPLKRPPLDKRTITSEFAHAANDISGCRILAVCKGADFDAFCASTTRRQSV